SAGCTPWAVPVAEAAVDAAASPIKACMANKRESGRDGNRAGHVGVERAEIFVCAGVIEGALKALSGRQRLGPGRAVLERHGVNCRVLVGPGDGLAHMHRRWRGAKSKACDGHLGWRRSSLLRGLLGYDLTRHLADRDGDGGPAREVDDRQVVG